ncbi:uncharacterized protein LOC135922166 isoform X2 [Gordionus sp. m RMFG-2023]
MGNDVRLNTRCIICHNLTSLFAKRTNLNEIEISQMDKYVEIRRKYDELTTIIILEDISYLTHVTIGTNDSENVRKNLYMPNSFHELKVYLEDCNKETKPLKNEMRKSNNKRARSFDRRIKYPDYTFDHVLNLTIAFDARTLCKYCQKLGIYNVGRFFNEYYPKKPNPINLKNILLNYTGDVFGEFEGYFIKETSFNPNEENKTIMNIFLQDDIENIHNIVWGKNNYSLIINHEASLTLTTEKFDEKCEMELINLRPSTILRTTLPCPDLSPLTLTQRKDGVLVHYINPINNKRAGLLYKDHLLLRIDCSGRKIDLNLNSEQGPDIVLSKRLQRC